MVFTAIAAAPGPTSAGGGTTAPLPLMSDPSGLLDALKHDPFVTVDTFDSFSTGSDAVAGELWYGKVWVRFPAGWKFLIFCGVRVCAGWFMWWSEVLRPNITLHISMRSRDDRQSNFWAQTRTGPSVGNVALVGTGH